MRSCSAQVLAQHLGQAPQQLIASRVAQRVIYLLEEIDVDHQHRQRSLAPLQRAKLAA